jgi:membrane protein YqaA with SNARE-associated domain
MESGMALAGALALCLLGGFLPWMNTEAVVVAAALVLPGPLVPVLVLGAALAQVAAKGTVYGLARWAPRGLPETVRARLARAAALARLRRSPTLTVMASSAVGVPPLFLVTLACGTAAVPFGAFLAAAFLGSVTRYAVLTLLTVLVWGAA